MTLLRCDGLPAFRSERNDPNLLRHRFDSGEQLFEAAHSRRPIRILMLGAVRTNGLLVAQLMRSGGFDVHVLLAADQLPLIRRHFRELPHWVRLYSPKPLSSPRAWLIYANLLRWMSKFDIIHSRCLGAMRWLPFIKPLGCIIVEQSVGSDLREGIVSDTRRVTEYYKRVDRLLVSQNDHLGLLESLRLPHARFLPLLADLTTYYRCGSELAWRDRDVVIFHPSHHDWTYNLGNRNSAKGNNKYRNSSKGNDRLIRAVARHVQNGTNCYLVMIEHGIDVFESKKLVNELGIDSHVQWLKPVTAAELRHLYCSADVVADQFDVGTPGLICLDALACGARVMCYIDENTARRAFGDLPPVFNCRSEDSIFEAIGQVQHQVWTEEDAVRSRAWVESHNGPDLVLRELRDVYVNAIN